MIRKEIKHLTLKVGEYDNITVGVPASVVSALVGEGLIHEPYFGNNSEELSSLSALGATFTAEFDMDAVMLGQDSLILRLHGIDAPMVLSVNGVPVAGLEHAHVLYEVDIKSHVGIGKNLLTLRFAPRAKGGDYIKDIGIFAPIELIAYNKAIIEDVTVSQKFYGDTLRLGINMTTKGYNIKPSAVAVLVAPSGAVSYSTLTDGVGEMTVHSPNLWRPGRSRGHRLYKLTVNLYSDSVLIDSREYKMGLRSVACVEKNGEAPRLTLCGSPYLPVAVRHGTADLISPRATEPRVALMLRRAADAGIDMIQIEPRGAYPSDHFLDCCDELGIALAIRAIVPDSPRSELGDKLAEKDLVRSLRRLAMHPSVLIIFGGGEYSDAVKRIASRLLPDTLYLEEGLFACDALPSLPGAHISRTYFGEDDMNLTAPAFTKRGCEGLERLLSSVTAASRMPHSFGEWSYLSSVLSAEECVRSLRSEAISPRGIGVTLAELTEPLPSLSPSVLDYRSGVKAAYYYLSRATRDRLVYAGSCGGKVSFFGVNKETNICKSRLNYSVISNDNRVIARDSVEISMPPESVSSVFEYDFSHIIEGHGNEYYLAFSLTDSRGTYSRDTHLFVPPREFIFKKPSIIADISGSGSEYAVTLYSDVYARAVEVYIDGEEDAVLEDNFIDITSDVAVRLKLTTLRPTAIETLKRELRVRSMYDVGR